jgi:hypothetical protein
MRWGDSLSPLGEAPSHSLSLSLTLSPAFLPLVASRGRPRIWELRSGHRTRGVAGEEEEAGEGRQSEDEHSREGSKKPPPRAQD